MPTTTGGILALAALIPERARGARRLILLGLFGTALLYGDGMITPAISVLSAVEGLEVVAPSVEAWVLPIVILILIALFSIQRHGTGSVGRFFGPVMLAWFAVLAVLGARQLATNTSVLRAVDPIWAVDFFRGNGIQGFLVLGSVFLVVTGGEALYADMGHIGRRPIQGGWFSIVLPALLLNYFGQGALLLDDPDTIENPFLLLAPEGARLPLIFLSAGPAIIASQALISGAFSLTVQAVNLGYLPRIRSVETSAHHRGQVYVPAINWFLLVACLVLVVTFGPSSRLAAAYGVAVTLTMLITTLLIAAVAYHRWKLSAVVVLAMLVPFAIVDVAFVSANLFKIPAGGWIPLLVGVVGFTLFTTWRTGRILVSRRIERQDLSIERFIDGLSAHPPVRHPGTGVYLHRTPGRVPPAFLANLRYNESLHGSVVFLSVVTDDRPHVPAAQRDEITHYDLGFHELVVHYGFTDEPDLSTHLRETLVPGVSFDPSHTTFFLGREQISATPRPGMAIWRERLFALMSRNVSDPSAHFDLPSDRCVDIGEHVDI